MRMSSNVAFLLRPKSSPKAWAYSPFHPTATKVVAVLSPDTGADVTRLPFRYRLTVAPSYPKAIHVHVFVHAGTAADTSFENPMNPKPVVAQVPNPLR